MTAIKKMLEKWPLLKNARKMTALQKMLEKWLLLRKCLKNNCSKEIAWKMTAPYVLRVSNDSLIFPPKHDKLLRTNCKMYIVHTTPWPKINLRKTAELQTPESTNWGKTNSWKYKLGGKNSWKYKLGEN